MIIPPIPKKIYIIHQFLSNCYGCLIFCCLCCFCLCRGCLWCVCLPWPCGHLWSVVFDIAHISFFRNTVSNQKFPSLKNSLYSYLIFWSFRNIVFNNKFSFHYVYKIGGMYLFPAPQRSKVGMREAASYADFTLIQVWMEMKIFRITKSVGGYVNLINPSINMCKMNAV